PPVDLASLPTRRSSDLREGVYLANYWGNGAGVGNLPPYVAEAFKLYRNYDGKGGKFGDTAVKASVPDNAVASVFAAKNSQNPGEDRKSTRLNSSHVKTS